jgi:hypothetical protein
VRKRSAAVLVVAFAAVVDLEGAVLVEADFAAAVALVDSPAEDSVADEVGSADSRGAVSVSEVAAGSVAIEVALADSAAIEVALVDFPAADSVAIAELVGWGQEPVELVALEG